MKFKGLGFKCAILPKFGILSLKLGYSHRTVFKPLKNILLQYKQKFVFSLEGRDLCVLKESLFNLKKIRKLGVYKKKGLYLKGVLCGLKSSSKQSKF